MKIIFKKILQYYLKFIAKIVLFAHRPVIIAVAGSVNKSFFKNSVVDVLLKNNLNVRSNENSFNTEIGLPLAILDIKSGYNSFRDWLPIIFRALMMIFRLSFPRILVLELGISRPGDMKYLLSLVSPEIIVVTDITQRYLESFGDMDNLAFEYEYLFKKAKKSGLVVFNNDNARLRFIAERTGKKSVSFGFGEGSDWKIADVKRGDGGQEFEVIVGGVKKKFNIKLFGKHNIYAFVAGLIIDNHVKEKKKKFL